MSKKSFEMARDIRGLRATVGRMVGQLYRRFDALGRGRKEAESRLREAEAEIDRLRRSITQLEVRVAELPNENVSRRISTIEGGRRGGVAGTLAQHDHTGAGDGGVLTNDEHDGYSEFTEISAPATPAGNDVRLYAKDKSGTSELFYKNDNGDERDLSTATLASHDHTSAGGDGGVLTNDEHDGYSEFTEISAPSTPAANDVRLYAKDKAGTSELYYKNDNGDERDLSATGGGGSPGGNDDEVQYKSGSSFAGAALTEIETGGNLRQVGVSADPSAPTSAIVTYGDDRATRYGPRFRAPVGDPSWLQTALWNKSIVSLNPQPSTTWALFGAQAYNYGTHTYNTALSNTDKISGMKRMLVGPNGSGVAFTSAYHNMFWRGDASGVGGFFYVFRGGVVDLTASVSRYMMGLHPYPDTTAEDPSAKTDLLAFAKDASDTTWQFMHNDGSGTATKVNTTMTVTDDVLLEAFIYCPPNGSTIYWELRDLETPSTQTGSVTTDLPSTTTFMVPWVWASGNAAGWSRLAVSVMYCETDY